MPVNHDAKTRLFVTDALASGQAVALVAAQAHFVRNVLRLEAGDKVLLFNGRDGEWLARIEDVHKRATVAAPLERLRPQSTGPDVDLCFAPLKHARLDYLVQKAVEMGASRLRPVLTRRTQAGRLNTERMRANVIEAAEQCGIIALPQVLEPLKLPDLLANWDSDRVAIFADEDAPAGDARAALAGMRAKPCALFVGPEGGFDDEERRALLAVPGCVRISLGPRILRADTAAVAGLALVQSFIGDWAAL